jgi:hypothetical protein
LENHGEEDWEEPTVVTGLVVSDNNVLNCDVSRKNTRYQQRYVKNIVQHLNSVRKYLRYFPNEDYLL